MRSAADEEAANDGQVWSAKNPPNEARTSDVPAIRSLDGHRPPACAPIGHLVRCSDPAMPSEYASPARTEESLAEPSSTSD
jgi:hypothetical protein